MATDNSTAKAATPTNNDIRQCGIVFTEVADMAARAQYLLAEIIDAASNPDEGRSVTELAASAQLIVERMGWAADFGSGKLDGTGHGTIRGDAEQWLMPPIYFWNQEAAQ